MFLLAYTASILSFTMPFLTLFVFKFYLNSGFIVWQRYGTKVGSQNRAATSGIAFIIQTGLGSKRSNYYDRFNLTILGYLLLAKLKSTSFWSWLSANRRELINAVLKRRLHLLLSFRLYKPVLLSGLYVPKAGNG